MAKKPVLGRRLKGRKFGLRRLKSIKYLSWSRLWDFLPILTKKWPRKVARPEIVSKIPLHWVRLAFGAADRVCDFSRRSGPPRSRAFASTNGVPKSCGLGTVCQGLGLRTRPTSLCAESLQVHESNANRLALLVEAV